MSILDGATGTEIIGGKFRAIGQGASVLKEAKDTRATRALFTAGSEPMGFPSTSGDRGPSILQGARGTKLSHGKLRAFGDGNILQKAPNTTLYRMDTTAGSPSGNIVRQDTNASRSFHYVNDPSRLDPLNQQPSDDSIRSQSVTNECLTDPKAVSDEDITQNEDVGECWEKRTDSVRSSPCAPDAQRKLTKGKEREVELGTSPILGMQTIHCWAFLRRVPDPILLN